MSPAETTKLIKDMENRPYEKKAEKDGFVQLGEEKLKDRPCCCPQLAEQRVTELESS